MPSFSSLLEPSYRANTADACHQAIKTLAYQVVVNSATSERADSTLSDDQVAMLTGFYLCLTAVFEARLLEEVPNLQTLDALLPSLVARSPLTLDQVFDALIRQTPRQNLGLLGPMCWAIVGGEPVVRPLLDALGAERITDIMLIQAVLDGCLAALRAAPNPILNPVSSVTMDNQTTVNKIVEIFDHAGIRCLIYEEPDAAYTWFGGKFGKFVVTTGCGSASDAKSMIIMFFDEPLEYLENVRDDYDEAGEPPPEMVGAIADARQRIEEALAAYKKLDDRYAALHQRYN